MGWLLLGIVSCADVLESRGAALLLWLHTMLCSIRNMEIIQTDWRRGVAVPIWKEKGDTQECNNYRGLTLLRSRSVTYWMRPLCHFL